MTSKEAYEQTLDNLVKFLTPIHCIDTKRQKPIEEMLSTFRELLDEYNELTHQPTLSECIKEWEERGWTSFKSKPFGWFIVEKDCKKIIFDWNEINYSCAKEFDIDLELNDLITKTLKALEEIKDGN